MAIALQGTPSLYENASSTTVVVPYPTGVTAGEVLLAHVGFTAGTVPAAAPSGWTLAQDCDGGANIVGAVYYRVADGSESGSVTFTSTGTAGRATGIMERWSGVDTTTPLDIAGATASNFGTSVTAPSVTTVTNGAVLTATVLVHAATAADITTASGYTKITGATGTGRRTAAYYKEIPTAGATGTQVWDGTQTGSLEMLVIEVVLRPATGGSPTPSLVQRMVGIPSTPSTNAVVSVKTTDATSVRLKLGTDSAVTTGVVWSSALTPSANGDTKHTISGLTPNTQYYFRVAMTDSGSTETLDSNATVGKFKTAPTGAANFNFCFGSCASGNDVQAMDAIAARGDDLFFQLGDLYYSDGTSTTVDNFRSALNNKISLHQNVFAVTNSSYTPSDHDGFANNSTSGNAATAWTNWNTVVGELFPMPATYYAFTWGRVRFIQLDSRSYKSDPAATDDSSKTALGATQKQWLKDEITNATEPLIVIVQDAPWIGAATAGDDGWFGYTTERTELASHFAASGQEIIMLGGDMHALAGDDGTNAPGGIYVFQASPLNQVASIKGGPWSTGTYPATGGSSVAQYGRCVVTDDGSSISVAYTGYSASTDTARITLTKTVNTVTDTTVSPTGIASAQAVGSPTVTSPATLSPTGIPSAQAEGSPTITAETTVSPVGIASGAFVGQPTMAFDVTVSPSGIASGAALGTPSAQPVNSVVPPGIPSAANVGTPTLSGTTTVSPVGIASREAFGTATATAFLIVSPTGIPTKRFVGQPSVSLSTTVAPIGIPSGAAFGETAIIGGGEFKTNYEVSISKKRWKGRLG